MKKGYLYIRALMIVAAAMSLSACGKIATTAKNDYALNPGTPNPIYSNDPALSQPVPSNYIMSSFTWTVSGGGDIQFTVVPSGTAFVVQVSRYQYRTVNVTLSMTQNDSAVAFQMLRNVFTGMDGFVSGYVAGNYSGTWSSLTQTDKSGRVYGPIQEPKLASGYSAAVSALFQSITSRLY